MIVRIKNYDNQEAAKKALEKGECEFVFISFFNEGKTDTQILCREKMAKKLKKRLGEKTNEQISEIVSFLFSGVNSNQAKNFLVDMFYNFL